jgi:hypothetical protein
VGYSRVGCAGGTSMHGGSILTYTSWSRWRFGFLLYRYHHDTAWHSMVQSIDSRDTIWKMHGFHCSRHLASLTQWSPNAILWIVNTMGTLDLPLAHFFLVSAWAWPRSQPEQTLNKVDHALKRSFDYLGWLFVLLKPFRLSKLWAIVFHLKYKLIWLLVTGIL